MAGENESERQYSRGGGRWGKEKGRTYIRAQVESVCNHGSEGRCGAEEAAVDNEKVNASRVELKAVQQLMQHGDTEEGGREGGRD